MSLFGKNIRKIRSVKSLSQQSFAEIFDLKRGTLGAYEEGRSEPKIETIIKIANHFSIPIGDLLTKELTVNQLLKFKGDLENSDLEDHKLVFTNIPCITPSFQNNYLEHSKNSNFVNDLPCLQIPVHSNAELRGYIIDDLEMSRNNDGFYPKDLVIGEKVPSENYAALESSCLFLIVSKENILLRRLFQAKNKFLLKAGHRGIDDLEMKYSEVKELWEVKYVFYHRVLDSKNIEVQEKLSYLEAEFKKLKSSL